MTTAKRERLGALLVESLVQAVAIKAGRLQSTPAPPSDDSQLDSHPAAAVGGDVARPDPYREFVNRLTNSAARPASAHRSVAADRASAEPAAAPFSPDVRGLQNDTPGRITLVNAGFLRRQRGFRITRPGREALEAATTRPGPLFTRLFLAQMGVPGAFLEPDGPTFRSPVGPALFLLSFLAADWVDSLWLTDRLLVPHLFPDLTPMQLGFSAYQWVVAPCLAFGLAEQREDLTRGGLSSVRITPLFGQFIEFVFPDEGRGRGHLRLVR